MCHYVLFAPCARTPSHSDWILCSPEQHLQQLVTAKANPLSRPPPPFWWKRSRTPWLWAWYVEAWLCWMPNCFKWKKMWGEVRPLVRLCDSVQQRWTWTLIKPAPPPWQWSWAGGRYLVLPYTTVTKYLAPPSKLPNVQKADLWLVGIVAQASNSDLAC